MSSASATDDDDGDGNDDDARDRSSESDSERDARSVELGTAPLLGTPREDGTRDDLDASGRRASAREVVREHGWVLGAFALSLVVTTMSMSVPFPFLSQEFARAGLDATRVGATFAALPFGVLVVSPTIAPRVLWRFDATMVAKYSLLGQAACVLATSAFAGRARWRVWLVCRLFQGFFNALTSVTMLCVVTRAAPDAVSITSGLQEVAAGFGTLIGPIFGGFLYDIHSSPKLPLMANGAAILLSIPPVMYAMRRLDGRDDRGQMSGPSQEERPSYARVLRRPTFLAAALAELVVSTSFGGIPTTLPLYLHQTLNFSPATIGLVYSLLAGLYALVTPIVGIVSHTPNSKVGDIVLCLIGMASMSVAHFFFGPSSLLGLPDPLSATARRRLCVWFPSVVYGVGSAFAFVPLLPLMQASVRNDGPKYADLANGLFVSCYFFRRNARSVIRFFLGARARIPGREHGVGICHHRQRERFRAGRVRSGLGEASPLFRIARSLDERFFGFNVVMISVKRFLLWVCRDARVSPFSSVCVSPLITKPKLSVRLILCRHSQSRPPP